MLKTQKLFKDKGHEEAAKFLSEELFITCKKYDNFYVLNYNQVFSPEDNDYVMECRSLQLDFDGNVISRAYPRFFNYGQRPEITSKFVFDDCSILEKVDGSLIRVYWNPFDNRWEIATRGTAFAESGQDFYDTFRDAVLHDGFGITEEQFQERCDAYLNSNFTYVFEYCSIKNRIVTLYPEPKMYLVVIVDNETGEEHAPISSNIVEFLQEKFSENIEGVQVYYYSNIDDMLKGLENLTDLKEGFVAQDVNGLRVKFKNSLYLKLHKMRGDNGFTPKKIASIVVEWEQEEVLTYFPEYKEMFFKYEIALERLFAEIDDVWKKYKNLESQKDFALSVKDFDFSSILFSMRKTGKHFSDIWEDLREDFKVELILKRVDDETHI